MVWLPAVSVEVVSFAVWALSVTVPSVAVPFLNVTVPVGVPLLVAGVTTAVKVTGVPTAEGFFDEVRVVTLASGVPVPLRLAAVEELLNGTLSVAFLAPTLIGRN